MTTETQVTVVPTTSMLSIFGTVPSAALDTALSVNSSAMVNPYPDIFQTGSEAAKGAFQVSDWLRKNKADVADILPDGLKPFYGVFLGYRLEIVAWPIKKDPADTTTKHKPVYSHVLPVTCTPEDMHLAMRACKAYQFTKDVEKHKFDYETAGAGHVRPTFKALVYYPALRNVLIVSSPSSFMSVQDCLEQMKERRDATGTIEAFPCKVVPETAPAKGKGRPHYYPNFVFDNASEKVKPAIASFLEWRTEVVNAPDVMSEMQDWIMGKGNELTDLTRKALVIAASFGR